MVMTVNDDGEIKRLRAKGICTSETRFEQALPAGREPDGPGVGRPGGAQSALGAEGLAALSYRGECRDAGERSPGPRF